MSTIKQVVTSRPYVIECGRENAAQSLITLVKGLQHTDLIQVAVVSDREVSGLYRDSFLPTLEKAGLKVTLIIIEGSQSAKNLDVVRTVYERLMDISFQKTDLLVGWGGGSVLDVTSFVASTFQGGVPYALLPTSLLGMLESAEAQSAYLNFQSHKDCIGVDCEPIAVIMDVDFLTTLPSRFMKNGYAQIIKYGMLDQITLLNRLVTKADMLITIDECYIAKSRIEEQEEDAFLFGHEIADAIEGHFRFLKYSQGESLAFAMLAMNPSPALIQLYTHMGFPTVIDGVSQETLQKHIAAHIAVYEDKAPVILANGNGTIKKQMMSKEEATAFFAQRLATILPQNA